MFICNLLKVLQRCFNSLPITAGPIFTGPIYFVCSNIIFDARAEFFVLSDGAKKRTAGPQLALEEKNLKNIVKFKNFIHHF